MPGAARTHGCRAGAQPLVTGMFRRFAACAGASSLRALPRTALWLVVTSVAAAAVAQLPSAAQARPPDAWAPALATARAYAQQRQGDVTFAVAAGSRRWGHRASQTHASASLVKAMLMTAYLRQPGVRARSLRADERALLGPMIRSSDNAAASRVRDRLPFDATVRLARAARMRHFGWNGDWGAARLSAADQAGFFLRLEALLPARHRAAALGWLRSIVPAQRWGLARAVPRGWRIAFKGGWRSEVNHQAALLTRSDERVGLAVLITGTQGQGYANATLEGVARRLLKGINRRAGARARPVEPRRARVARRGSPACRWPLGGPLRAAATGAALVSWSAAALRSGCRHGA